MFEIVLDHFENLLELVLIFVSLDLVLIDQEELIEHKNQLNKDEIGFFLSAEKYINDKD